MRPYAGRRIVLGVTGGIASYKTGWLARLLTAAEAEVDVVMTRAATEFVGPVTFEALTGRPPFRGESLLDTLQQVRSQEPVEHQVSNGLMRFIVAENQGALEPERGAGSGDRTRGIGEP